MRQGQLACLLMVGAIACASSPKDVNRQMAGHLDGGNVAGALEVLEGSEAAYQGGDELLYGLERGMLLHYLGRFRESNAAFEQAKREAEQHYTKSISRELGTYMVSDTTVPYYGEPYERAMLHVVSALNYAALGDMDASLVELRQLDAFVRKLDVDRVGGTFRDDAYGRLLAGMLYEDARQLDEAFVSYKHALAAYQAHSGAYGLPPPPLLGRDVSRVASSLGRWAMQDLAAIAPGLQASAGVAKLAAEDGRLVLVHYSGRAPYKVEVTFNVTVGKGWGFVNKIESDSKQDDQMKAVQGAATGALSRESFQVAVPKIERVSYRIKGLELLAPGGPWGSEVLARSELASRPGKVLEQTLDDEIAWIRARAVARATVKYVLARLAEEGVRQSGGDSADVYAQVLRIGLGVARNLSEEADVRSWFTAPDEITLTEVTLPAGTYDFRVRFVAAGGQGVATEDVLGVEVKPGARTWRIVRSVR